MEFIMNKLQLSELVEFMKSLSVVKRESGIKIIEHKKKSNFYYIFLYGEIGIYSNIEGDASEIKIDEG